MASRIALKSGSIFNGNPITFEVTPTILDTPPSFHRVVVEVKCGMTGGNFDTIKMFEPVLEEKSGTTVEVDVSSALRTFRDAYVYTSEPTVYPMVKFRVSTYDEYMLNGEVHSTEPITYPIADKYLCTLFGAFSDIERLSAGETKGVTRLSTKPTSSPHLVSVGEPFAYTSSYVSPQTIEGSESLVAPESKVTVVTKEGQQILGGQSVYAMPATEGQYRDVFRFINSFGVLESVSVPKAHREKLNISSSSYVRTIRETFSRFSRSLVKKTGNQETWTFETDPLNEDWLRWYLHEFFMSEHVWILVGNRYLPCTIETDDDIAFVDHTQSAMYSLSFSAKFGIYGNVRG